MIGIIVTWLCQISYEELIIECLRVEETKNMVLGVSDLAEIILIEPLAAVGNWLLFTDMLYQSTCVL